MATILHPNGTHEEVQPQHGDAFSLDEMQGFVGGLIEIVGRTEEGRIAVGNEEGRLQGLPYNALASVTVFVDPRLTHRRPLVGPVVLVTRTEMGDDEDNEDDGN